MADVARIRISFRAMLCYVLPAGALTGAIGAYPTWVAGGARALWAELSAGAIVLGVMTGSAVVIVRSAARGPGKVAMAFLTASLIRVVACLGLAGGAWAVFHLPPLTLCLWLIVFYLVVLAAEVVWLARALRRGMAA
jgi:hypothetical protein